MPKITVLGVDGVDTIEADGDTRLVNALSDAGVDLGHRCGGHAKCTTCRVEFTDGEPDRMTEAEANKLVQSDLLGDVRLSCQIMVDHDMTVRPLMLASSDDTPWDDPGTEPEERMTPDPLWVTKLEVERR